MKRYRLFLIISMCSIFAAEVCVLGAAKKCEVSGELKKWHNVTLTFTGPDTSEDAKPNPFRDYRLTVTFAKGRKRRIPAAPNCTSLAAYTRTNRTSGIWVLLSSFIRPFRSCT